MRKRRRGKPKLRVAFIASPLQISPLNRIASLYESKLGKPPESMTRAEITSAAVSVGLDKIERRYGLPPLELVPDDHAKSDEAPASRTRPACNLPQSGVGAKQ